MNPLLLICTQQIGSVLPWGKKGGCCSFSPHGSSDVNKHRKRRKGSWCPRALATNLWAWQFLCVTAFIVFLICIYLFIFGRTGLCCPAPASGGLLTSCGVWASHCGSSSCRRAGARGCEGFRSVARRLSSRGASAWLSCGRTRDWDCPGRTRTGNLPGPGIEPVSLALAGGLLTTRPPGRSLSQPLICAYYEPSPGPGTPSGWSPSNLKTALWTWCCCCYFHVMDEKLGPRG